MPVAPRRRPAVPVLLALLAAFAAGCDAEPGLPEEVARPTLADVRVTPTRDSLASDAPTATIPLRVEATLGGAGPAEVRVLVRYAETDSLAAEARVEAAPGPVAIDVPLTVSRGATGDYEVQVSTEGADGRPGDQAAAVVRFAAASLGPPVVTAVEFAGAVDRPSTGSRTVPVVATVADPDGRANVALVALTLADGGVLGRLFDDGRNSDQRAGDGRFSAGLTVFATSEPGTVDLAVIAVDRSGMQSAPFPLTLTIR